MKYILILMACVAGSVYAERATSVLLSAKRQSEIALRHMKEIPEEDYAGILERFRTVQILPMAFACDGFDVALCADPEWNPCARWSLIKLNRDGSSEYLEATPPLHGFYSRPGETYLVRREGAVSVLGLFARTKRSERDEGVCWSDFNMLEPVVSVEGKVSIEVHTNVYPILSFDSSEFSIEAPWIRVYKIPDGTDVSGPNPLARSSVVKVDDAARRTLIDQFRRSVKALLMKPSPVTVYAVFADADGDGECDAYLASGRSHLGNGRYCWRLYLQKKGAWMRCEKAIRLPVPGAERVYVEEEAEATPEDFFSVQRCDLPSTILITQHEDGRISSYSYLRRTSPEMRSERRRPEGMLLYRPHDGQPSHGIRDFLDYFTEDCRLLQMKRLTCEVFEEEDSAAAESCAEVGSTFGIIGVRERN